MRLYRVHRFARPRFAIRTKTESANGGNSRENGIGKRAQNVRTAAKRRAYILDIKRGDVQ